MVSWSEDGWWIEMEIVILKLKAPKKYTSVIPHFIFPCFSHLHPALSSMIKRPRAYSIILTRLTEDWPWRQSLLTCFPFSSSPSLFAPSLLFLKKFPHNHAPPKKFACMDGSGRIAKADICNGYGDCHDNSHNFPSRCNNCTDDHHFLWLYKASIFVLI